MTPKILTPARRKTKIASFVLFWQIKTKLAIIFWCFSLTRVQSAFAQILDESDYQSGN